MVMVSIAMTTNLKQYRVKKVKNLLSKLILLCVVLQILDGTLTAIGLSIFPEGIDAEGNPLVKWIMVQIGIIPGLLILKSIAVLILLRVRRTVLKSPPWVALTILCVILDTAYLYAVGSWIYIFIIRYGRVLLDLI